MILAIVSFRIKIKGSPNSRSSKIKRKFFDVSKNFLYILFKSGFNPPEVELSCFLLSCVVIDRDSFSSSAPWTYTTHAAGITGASWDRKNLNTASRSMLRR